jgi:hypothetical protein
VKNLKRIKLSDAVIDYIKLALFVAFGFVALAAIITFNFRIVMGALVLGAALGFIIYTGVRE